MQVLNEEYLIGRLTVHFGVDIVSLAHNVQGRVSFMDLVEGDQIEVKEGDYYRSISTKDVLDTLVDYNSLRNEVWKCGSSFYEGSQVRVKLDPRGNKKNIFNRKKIIINKVMTALKQGHITHEEAAQAFLKLELEDDE